MQIVEGIHYIFLLYNPLFIYTPLKKARFPYLAFLLSKNKFFTVIRSPFGFCLLPVLQSR